MPGTGHLITTVAATPTTCPQPLFTSNPNDRKNLSGENRRRPLVADEYYCMYYHRSFCNINTVIPIPRF